MNNITATLVCVTPEQAAQWLAVNNFERQRPLRSWHVRYLAQAMEGDRFTQGTQMHFVRHAGHDQLVNGQHTLAAIVQSGKAQWLTIQITMVDKAEDVAILYGRADRGLSRTLSDSYHAHGFAELSGLAKAQANDLGGCMPLILSGFTHYGGRTAGEIAVYFRDQDLRWNMMVDWLDEACTFFEDIARIPGFLYKALTRQSVMGVALVTYRHTGKDAKDFWRAVAKDDGLAADHPAKTLIRFLCNTPAKLHMPSIYAKYVASTWNAFYTERSLSRVFIRDASLPILLEGTPHTHKGVMRYIRSNGEIVKMPFLAPEQPSVHRPGERSPDAA